VTHLEGWIHYSTSDKAPLGKYARFLTDDCPPPPALLMSRERRDDRDHRQRLTKLKILRSAWHGITVQNVALFTKMAAKTGLKSAKDGKHTALDAICAAIRSFLKSDHVAPAATGRQDKNRTEACLLLAGARVRDVEPVPVARPTRELGVGVLTVAYSAAYALCIQHRPRVGYRGFQQGRVDQNGPNEVIPRRITITPRAEND